MQSDHVSWAGCGGGVEGVEEPKIEECALCGLVGEGVEEGARVRCACSRRLGEAGPRRLLRELAGDE